MALKLLRQTRTAVSNLTRRGFSSRILNEDEECPRKRVLIETDEL
jgi:hypothetical protein